MSTPLRLVIFDVDGTLVDSQGDILGAMRHAFETEDLEVPSRTAVLGIVGLSLPVAMSRLAPQVSPALQDRLVEGYKAAYVDMRASVGAAQSSPLYPGARDCLEKLHSLPDVLMGVATGKSKRGLDSLITAHDLGPFFITQQVADFHPSKPHPSMILQAMTDAGAAPENTVMIGDTSFDMDMAQAAGVHGIGVSWGYHPVSALEGASEIADDFGGLWPAISKLWGL